MEHCAGQNNYMNYYHRCELAFAQQGISSAEKFILVAMARRSGNEMAEYYQSIASLSAETSLNRKTVIKSLKNLCEAGFISDIGKRVGDTKQVVVYQINGIFKMIEHAKSDALNSPKIGTVPESEQFQISPETDSNLPANSPNFSAKESQIYAETVPKLGHGINKGINKGNKNHVSDKTHEKLFSEFYGAYPGNRKNRADAKKAWDKLNPSEELITEIMSGLDRSKQSRDWLKDDGQYIPAPAVWLNKHRWEDEIKPIAADKASTSTPYLGLWGAV